MDALEQSVSVMVRIVLYPPDGGSFVMKSRVIVSKGQAFSVGEMCYNPRTCRAPIFLFPSRPLALLTQLSPLPSDSHRPLPI